MSDSDETWWQDQVPPASDRDPRFLPVGLYEARSNRSLRLFRSPVEASLSLSIPLYEITSQLCTDPESRDHQHQHHQHEYHLCWISRLAMSSKEWREWLEESNRRNLPVSRILQLKDDPARLAEWAQSDRRARQDTCRGPGRVSNNDADAMDDEDDEEDDEEDDAVDEWAEEAANAITEHTAVSTALTAFWEQFKAEKALAMTSDASAGEGMIDGTGTVLSDPDQTTEEVGKALDDGKVGCVVKQGLAQGQGLAQEQGLAQGQGSDLESDRDSSEPTHDLKRKALGALEASRNQQLAESGWILEQSSDFPDSQWIGRKVRRFLPDKPYCWVDSTVTAVMPDTAAFAFPLSIYSLHAVAGSDSNATSRGGASCFNVVDGGGSHEQLSLAALKESSDFYDKKITCDPGSTKHFLRPKTGPRPATLVRAGAPEAKSPLAPLVRATESSVTATVRPRHLRELPTLNMIASSTKWVQLKKEMTRPQALTRALNPPKRWQRAWDATGNQPVPQRLPRPLLQNSLVGTWHCDTPTDFKPAAITLPIP